MSDSSTSVATDGVVPLLCVANSNVVPGLLALIASVVAHLKWGWQLDVHVLDLGLSCDEHVFVRKALQPFGERVCLAFCRLDVDVCQSYTGSVHVNVAAYGKCYLFDIFPELSWGIYADVDMLIRMDLSQLGYNSLCGYPLAAVPDWEGTFGDRLPRELLEGEGIDPALSYLNTGFMVLDLEQIRSMLLQDKMLMLIHQYGEHFKYLDQDAFNLALRGNWMRLDFAYNTLFTLTDDLPRRLPRKACNPHTVGRNKAWKFKRAGARGLVRNFYAYLDMTDAGYEDCPGAHQQYPVGMKRFILYLDYYYERFLRAAKKTNHF
jgi:lipopolysaccharide biosynthesis glycosyltransferase